MRDIAVDEDLAQDAVPQGCQAQAYFTQLANMSLEIMQLEGDPHLVQQNNSRFWFFLPAWR